MTDLREKLDNFRSWANIPGDPIREPRRSYIGRYHSALAKAWESGALVPAPAVPDDVAEVANTLRKATFTKGRTRGGIGGQTIEANMRSTFHEVSAWDLDRAADALEAQAAELARLREGYSKIQEAGLGGYLTPELVAQITRAALTQPTGD